MLAGGPALAGAVLYFFGFTTVGVASFALSLAQTAFVWRGRLWPIAVATVLCGAALFAASVGLWIGFQGDRLTFEAGEPPSDILRSTYWWSLIAGFLVAAVGTARAAWPSRWAFAPPIALLSFALVFIPALSYFALVIISGWAIVNFIVVGTALLRLVR
jgi:hypothetical protein